MRSSSMTRTAQTGPLGRAARLALLGLTIVSLLSIVDSRGSAHFRNPHILLEPLPWVLHIVMLVVFVALVGSLASAFDGAAATRRSQVGAVVAVAITITVGGVIGTFTQGAFWGFPLADMVWWFDVLLLIEQILALGLAVALGTRGCEVGVWTQLLARTGLQVAVVPQEGLACVVGLHFLDAWEARRQEGATPAHG